MNKVFYIFFLFTAAIIVGCNKDNEFPDEPEITSLKFDYDVNALIVTFTDGDGDFGISSTSTDPQFADSVQDEDGNMIFNPYYHNLWIELYEKEEGEWLLVETPGSLNHRVTELTPQGQNKQLDVRITNDLSGELPALFSVLDLSDTLKFNVQLVDRSLNISQPRETEELVIPH